MSDWALFLTSAGLALVSAAAAIAAAVMAFRWRKAALANGAPPQRNGNGRSKHRPWFRFWLTLVGLLGFFVIIETILTGTIKLTVTTAALIGSVLNGLITLLILSFKWWFETADETPNTTEQHADEPPKKALPDDY